MKVIVLLNVKAGRRDRPLEVESRVQELRATFSANRVDAEVLTVPSDELANAVRMALQSRPDAVVAAGGDGSISTVASALVHTGMPLGILPLGTLNHFAKDLGVPLSIADAVRVIAAGSSREIDLGQVNDRAFINNVSIGFYPQVVLDRETQRHRLGRGKWVAMFVAVVNAMQRFPVVSVRVIANNRSTPTTTSFVFVGNNVYETSLLTIGQRERLDQGCLSLYVAKRIGRLGMIRLALRALLGRLDQARDFDGMKLEELWIETAKQCLRVAIDGDVHTIDPPLHFRSLPRALRVLSPSEGDA